LETLCVPTLRKTCFNAVSRPSGPTKHGSQILLTCQWQKDGFFLAAVLDIFSRRVVGWSFSQQADESLVADALQMALHLRKPAAGMIHHCDQGSQYTAVRYGAKLIEHGLIASMSRKGNCHDNAVAESFFGSLKRELQIEKSVRGRSQTQELVHDYIEKFYNRVRLHSTLGSLSPAEYELVRIA
jgi:putative transposase